MMEISFYREKLSESGHRMLNASIEESQRRHHYYLGLEHLFIAYAEQEKTIFRELMASVGLSVEAVLYSVNEHLNISRQYLGVGLKVPPATKQVFRVAWETAQRNRRSLIDAADLFLGIFHEVHSIPARILKNYGVDPAVALSRFSTQLRSREEKVEEFRKRYELPANLRTFGVNLNLLAREGRIPPIVGRDREIDRIIEYLCHKDRSNSVMIVGDPGVGKTAVVEGLAMRLEYEPHRVPRRLRAHQIVNLQMNTVVAGTVFRGMFEDRIEKVIAEVRDRKNLILFIDEAHTLIGAGSAMGVPSDAANIFKSTLARGEVQIIGATTYTEFKEIIQEDEALARRFRVVKIEEPTVDETRDILFGLKPRLETNYGVEVTEEAIEFALSMSDRYARSLRLPDKIINWIDTACVRVEINRDEEKTVKSADVLGVIAEETKTPADIVRRDVLERFRDLEERISRRLVGQHEAIRAVAKALRLNKGPLKENVYRPDGVLLFLGPTGVGKTEMAKALAEYLFGDERHMVRVDMSEYRDGALAVDKLIGMPRGIVGSERGGILTNQVRDNPYTVVLLDEIEKADSYVHNLFLQVFDEGWLTDGRGKKVYFSDAIIIMTSNLGAEELSKLTRPLGFATGTEDFEPVRKSVLKAVENRFTPEFINRLDDVIVFSPLSFDEVKRIASIYLESIRRTMAVSGKKLLFSDASLEALSRTGFSVKYGARFLKRHIDEKVKMPITLRWKESDRFFVEAEGGEVVVIPEGVRI
ncbi:MAG TPA: ATP-dependent Clp protease ATP-binding subunit [Candidatus Deferrimicrobiaceae bacterium]|nr:ATP-dependent Clp protease ATP-binding subunit [Candidatus Deferrimicrobiaceae bacterium]